jgi:DedD protein
VQEHLKVRLTGAIILVALVVMLVPEMFRGRPQNRAARGETAVDELPLRSYTIDLRRNPEPQSGAAAPVSAPASTPISAPAATVPAPASTPPTSVEATTVPVPAPALAAAAPAPAAVAPAARSGARWTVQVGTFARREYADRMLKQLHAMGFAVVAAGPDEHGRYRVRSATLTTRAGAEALRQKMVQKGLKPIVNTAP